MIRILHQDLLVEDTGDFSLLLCLPLILLVPVLQFELVKFQRVVMAKVDFDLPPRRPNIQVTAHQVPGIQPVDGASSLKAQMDDIVEGIDSLLLSPCRLPSETSSNKGSARSIAGSDDTLSMTASELEAINDVTSGAGLGFLMDENRNTVDGAAALPLDPVTLFSRSLVSQQDTLESILRWIEDDAPYEGYTPFPDYLLMLLQVVVEENATCLDNVCTIRRAEGCKCPCTCKAAKKD